MGAFEKITVELPEEAVERLRARVASGEYASESDVVRDALLELDHAGPSGDDIEAWLRGPVAQACDEVRAGTATLLTHEEMCARLGISAKRAIG